MYFVPFWDTQRQIMASPRNQSLGSFKVIENGTIRKLGYGFLFAFHANYGSAFSRFDTIRERDSQPATASRHRPRLCIVSRGKKWLDCGLCITAEEARFCSCGMHVRIIVSCGVHDIGPTGVCSGHKTTIKSVMLSQVADVTAKMPYIVTHH